MSARQPFLPSRPASRALNRGDDAGATSVHAALPNNPPSDANDSAELGKPTRALNIAGFKKSAPRTTSFGTGPAELETAQGPRSAAKGTPARIYAPHPSTPSAVPSPLPGFPTPEFKTPSLPFSRSAEEGPNNAHTSPPAEASVPNLFRPKSSAQTTRRPPPPSSSSEQSFFGNAKFLSNGGGGGDLDDSGYFSEHTDTEVDRFGPVRHAGDPRSVKARPVPDIDARFVNSTKRARPASPGDGDDEDIPMAQQSNRPRDFPKRRRASPSSLSSRTAPMLESAPDEGTPAFALPPHIPHPMAAMGDLPGLEFSEADLARYAELYEQGSERWSKAPTEEWVAGADDVLAKFGEMIDMIKDHMRCVSHLMFFLCCPSFVDSIRISRMGVASSKMNLYKSLHTRLSDEQSALDQRAKELRGASQTLVRDSGTIGGALDSHEVDARAH
ncbi:hypothetical protein EDB92DRAFT_1568137 [Lactarius akahatsu]|uniref:Extracellular mutant protein 11 C-terminal domain-containing protein n=1 Tax=Lactarius akahatsu TaxID=416441 RepID=A0AAD4LA62_9AGAM|nr:hypothetical protein EDB92DRAFT_1568137 [Lactarius akahatsu]